MRHAHHRFLHISREYNCYRIYEKSRCRGTSTCIVSPVNHRTISSRKPQVKIQSDVNSHSTLIDQSPELHHHTVVRYIPRHLPDSARITSVVSWSLYYVESQSAGPCTSYTCGQANNNVHNAPSKAYVWSHQGHPC